MPDSASIRILSRFFWKNSVFCAFKKKKVAVSWNKQCYSVLCFTARKVSCSVSSAIIYTIVFEQNQCSVLFLQSRSELANILLTAWFFWFWQVVEEYNKQIEEIQQLTEYLEEKKKELDNYKQNISQVITEIITSVWYQYIFIRIECIYRNRE